MTWALIAWCVLIVVWAIAGGAHATHTCSSRAGSQFLTAQQAQNACNTGVGIGVLVILFIGFIGFVFLSLIWFMTRPRDGR